MGREATPLPTFAGNVWFVPDVVLENSDGEVEWDNRKDPEPMACEIIPLTSHEFNALQLTMATRDGTKLAKKRRGKISEEQLAVLMAARFQRHRDEVVSRHVPTVMRWRCAELAPKTGAELVKALSDARVSEDEREKILSQLMTAIGDASVLSEGLLGKFVPASGSASGAESSAPPGSGTGDVGAVVESERSLSRPESRTPIANGGGSTTATA